VPFVVAQLIGAVLACVTVRALWPRVEERANEVVIPHGAAEVERSSGKAACAVPVHARLGAASCLGATNNPDARAPGDQGRPTGHPHPRLPWDPYMQSTNDPGGADDSGVGRRDTG
jgi:hypothetical protein